MNLSKQSRWLDFNSAKKSIQKLKFNSVQEFEQWVSSSKRPANIPSTPRREYKDEWQGWSDFLGTKLNYQESKKAIKPLNIKSIREYRERSNELPRGVPRSRPDLTFKKKGEWISWIDYLDKKSRMKK